MEERSFAFFISEEPTKGSVTGGSPRAAGRNVPQRRLNYQTITAINLLFFCNRHLKKDHTHTHTHTHTLASVELGFTGFYWVLLGITEFY